MTDAKAMAAPPPYSVLALALRAEVTAIRQILECALTGLYTADELERLAKASGAMADELAPTEISKALALLALARIYGAAAKSPLHDQIAARRDLFVAKPSGSA